MRLKHYSSVLRSGQPPNSEWVSGEAGRYSGYGIATGIEPAHPALARSLSTIGGLVAMHRAESILVLPRALCWNAYLLACGCASAFSAARQNSEWEDGDSLPGDGDCLRQPAPLALGGQGGETALDGNERGEAIGDPASEHSGGARRGYVEAAHELASIA